MTTSPRPTRQLPPRPDLDQLRKQARELLRAYRAGKEAAVEEVERFERTLDPSSFSLTDAQRVLARAHGFSSWPALREHVDGVTYTALLAAVDAGDLNAVLRIAGARPDLVNPDHAELRDSPLHRAVLHRDEPLTRVLMQLGANAHTGIWPHREATTAYAIAVDREYTEIVAAIKHEEARRRARLGGEVSSAGEAIEALGLALREGSSAAAISLMQADPALIGACDVDGVTPLHLAAWRHDSALVRWLLDHGASPHALALCAEPVQREPADSGKTPLDFAAIVAGWASGANTCPAAFLENAALEPALFHETARLLLERGAELTPRAAVALGDREHVLRLKREGRLAQEIHKFRGGLIAVAVRVNRRDLVATLLDLGLNPDESVVTDDGARSWGMPLWFASRCGRHEIAELLLARGADVNAVVYACGDALCMAADEKMELVLQRNGARFTVEQVTDLETARAILDGTLPAQSLNVDSPTPEDLAEQLLLAAGGHPDFVRLCLPRITRDRGDPWWSLALLGAADPAGLGLLLEHGVQPDVRGDGGYTLLHHVVAAESSEEARLARAALLLDAGASLAERDTLLKSTPLGWACRWGRVAFVKLYLERGARAIEPDAEPWATPLAWATKRGHQEVLELLRSAGAK